MALWTSRFILNRVTMKARRNFFAQPSRLSLIVKRRSPQKSSFNLGFFPKLGFIGPCKCPSKALFPHLNAHCLCFWLARPCLKRFSERYCQYASVYAHLGCSEQKSDKLGDIWKVCFAQNERESAEVKKNSTLKPQLTKLLTFWAIR